MINASKEEKHYYWNSKICLKDQAFSQEVDYDMFELKFWPKNKGNKLNLSALNIWTEIYSVIKGGTNFYYYRYHQVMPLNTYMTIKSSMSFLSNEEKIKVYYIYVRYEQWKNENNLYDFMDVVRHV